MPPGIVRTRHGLTMPVSSAFMMPEFPPNPVDFVIEVGLAYNSFFHQQSPYVPGRYGEFGFVEINKLVKLLVDTADKNIPVAGITYTLHIAQLLLPVFGAF